MIRFIAIIILVFRCVSQFFVSYDRSWSALAFVPIRSSRRPTSNQALCEATRHCCSTAPATLKASPNAENWIYLTDDKAVRKRILQEGSGETTAQLGQTVAIDYIGNLGEIDWDTQGVIDCWLLSQQGLDGLVDAFQEANIDAAKLMDDTFFTEDLCRNVMSLSNKFQIKKLVMASRRLAKSVADYPAGTPFDSNKDRNDGAPYHFQLGEGKAIRAMELAVRTMKPGERVEIIARADYAYGKEGLRKTNGDVVVPEYATLCFEVTLWNCM
jgi:FKBP-type peptidyl-prolyl cis-trans isomerase